VAAPGKSVNAMTLNDHIETYAASNLHMKAGTPLLIKVRTKKVRDDSGEGLIFQFLDPEREETQRM